MAGILQQIWNKLGKKSASSLVEALKAKNVKWSTVAKEIDQLGLDAADQDLVRTALEGAQKQASELAPPLQSAKPTGSSTIASMPGNPKMAKQDAAKTLTGAKQLVADMRKVNKTEADIEKAVRQSYPDLGDTTLDNVMGRSGTVAPDVAEELRYKEEIQAEPVLVGKKGKKGKGVVETSENAERVAQLKDQVKSGTYKPWSDEPAFSSKPPAEVTQSKPVDVPSNDSAMLGSTDTFRSESPSHARLGAENPNSDTMPSTVPADNTSAQVAMLDEFDDMGPYPQGNMESPGIDVMPGADTPRMQSWESPSSQVNQGDRGDAATSAFNMKEDDTFPSAETLAAEDNRANNIFPPDDVMPGTETFGLDDGIEVFDPSAVSKQAPVAEVGVRPRDIEADHGVYVDEATDPLESGMKGFDSGTPMDLEIPAAELDELRNVGKSSDLASKLPPVPEDVRKPMMELDLSTPAKTQPKPDPANSKVTSTLDVSQPKLDPSNAQVTSTLDLSQPKGSWKKPAAVGAGILGLTSATIGGDPGKQVAGTQVDGGTQQDPLTGAPVAAAPIKTAGPTPEGTPVGEFSSADPSTNPSKVSSKQSASMSASGKTQAPAGGAPAEAIQKASSAIQTAQEQAGEIDKRIPGWGDTMKQALSAQVSAYEKLTAELKQDLATAANEAEASRFKAGMGEALTAFAQALVKYGAASEGVKRKLDVANYYQATPADFTRVFKAIDDDFKMKTDSIREALKGAKEGIASANERLMKVEDRENEQAFKSSESEQAYLRDLKAKILDNQQQMQMLEAKAGYDAAAAAELAKRRQDDINLRGQWGVQAAAARGASEGGAKGREIADMMKALTPPVNADKGYIEAQQNENQGVKSSLEKILTTPNVPNSKRNKAMEDLAESVGVPPVYGTSWWGGKELDVGATAKAIRDKAAVAVPNAPAASDLAGKTIGAGLELFGPKVQQRIKDLAPGKLFKVDGVQYRKLENGTVVKDSTPAGQ